MNENQTKQRWDFYLPDHDRSTGWDNHGTILQFVTHGSGATATEAWVEACIHDRIPEDFQLPEMLTAIPFEAGELFHADTANPLVQAVEALSSAASKVLEICDGDEESAADLMAEAWQAASAGKLQLVPEETLGGNAIGQPIAGRN